MQDSFLLRGIINVRNVADSGYIVSAKPLLYSTQGMLLQMHSQGKTMYQKAM